MITDIQLLYNKHGLSYQQIDRYLETSQLNHLYKNDLIKSMALVREMLFIIDYFNEKNKILIPLKGPALSDLIYKNPFVRRCHDLDFLIDFKDINFFIDFFEKNGYILITDINKLGAFKDLVFVNRKKKIIVELHWSLLDYYVFDENFDEFIEKNTKDIVFQNRKIKVFTNEFNLFYITIHAVNHRFERLKWLIDINDFLFSVDFDKSLFEKLVSEYELYKVVNIYDEICKIYVEKPNTFNLSDKKPSSLILNFCINEIERNGDLKNNPFVIIKYYILELIFRYYTSSTKTKKIFIFNKFFIRNITLKRFKSLIFKRILNNKFSK